MGRALAITRLDIRRFLGIRRASDRFAYEGCFVPGINVVVGPNGSGKTTTALAMQAALWPTSPEAKNADLTAEFNLPDGSTLVMDKEGRFVRYQGADGSGTAPTDLPSAENRVSYRLSLHELLVAEDGALAEAVTRELNGGFDLTAAASSLTTAPTIRTINNCQKTFTEARRQVQSVQVEQTELFEAERTLAELTEQECSCRAQRRVVEHIAAVLALRNAERIATERQQEKSESDPRILKLRGDEMERLERIATELREAEALLERRRKALAKLERQRVKEKSADAVTLPLLQTLKARLSALQVVEGRRGDERVRLAESAEVAKTARAEIATHLTEEQIERLKCIPPMQQVRAFAERCTQLEGMKTSMATFAALPGVREADESGAKEAQRLAEGIRHLDQWLTVPEERRGDTLLAPASVLWALAAAVGLIALVCALVVHPLFWLFSFLSPALVVLSRMRRTQDVAESADTRRNRARDAFLSTDLTTPASWSGDTVRERREELVVQQADATARGVFHTARQTVEASLEQQRQTVEKQVEELSTEIREALGVSLDMMPEGILLLVGRIAAWRDAAGRHAEAEKALNEIDRQASELVEALRESAGPFAPEDASADAAVFAGLVEDLERRREAWVALTHKQESACSALADAERDVERLSREREDVFGQAGLAGIEERLDVLREWLVQKPAATQAEKECLEAETLLRKAQSDIGEMDVETAKFAGNSEEELALLRDEARTDAERLEEIQGRKTEIEVKVERARTETRLAEALMVREKHKQVLLQVREDTHLAAAGRVCVDLVRGGLESSASVVLTRAREMFSTITNHRYELSVSSDDGQASAFTVRDTTSHETHGLETLSSGTRVQLLVAVRLAFIERCEGGGPALPLVLDEALGNSDDTRASALVQAMVEIARTGRQIFYFTAQRDEVGKWRAAAESADVSYAEIMLPLGCPKTLELSPSSPQKSSVPEPANLSLHEYGHALGVAVLDPLGGDVDSAHIWYAFDETALPELHALLLRGFQSCGQVASLIRTGGSEAFAIASGTRLEALDRVVLARVELLREIARLWSVGRGRPLRRIDLAAADGITTTFLDRVWELAEAGNGDGVALLEGLAQSKVRGFRKTGLESLEAWLIEKGFVDPRERLSLTELRAAAFAAVASLPDGELLTGKDVDRILGHFMVLDTPITATETDA
ncbi:MAG: AAA family ATPase [Lentisphaeria bacterium]|nr:AAA family ATPase [Lentisphaeria bacterium]